MQKKPFGFTEKFFFQIFYKLKSHKNDLNDGELKESQTFL